LDCRRIQNFREERMMMGSKLFVAGCSSACAVLLASSAVAVDVRITVQNLSGPTGFAISPVIASAHNGSVDMFNTGMAASAGVENVAELGAGGALLIGEIIAQQPSAAAAPVENADGSISPLLPGATQSVVLSLDPTANRYFSYLAMFVPSNDAFIGNDNPMQIPLFDAGGAFVAQNFTLTGNRIWDAGTEVNGLTGAAFVAGQDVMVSPVEGGVIHLADLGEIFSYYVGQTTPPGYSFSGGPAAETPIAAFSFAVVPEPAAWWLAALGIGACALFGRRRSAATCK
jgi:hypothetical protein